MIRSHEDKSASGKIKEFEEKLDNEAHVALVILTAYAKENDLKKITLKKVEDTKAFDNTKVKLRLSEDDTISVEILED